VEIRKAEVDDLKIVGAGHGRQGAMGPVGCAQLVLYFGRDKEFQGPWGSLV